MCRPIKANTKLKVNEKSQIESKILGLSENGASSDNENAYIALKYFDRNYQCFSEWDSGELSCFSKFVEKVNNLTWRQIKAHTGLGFKDIDTAKGLPNNKLKDTLSKDITFCEFRVTQKARVVGFRVNAVFFLCWLDRNHEICPM